ncbi:alpha/beta fold hydrolase [Candidatus Albibeggiatoa sp. nov. NOAA]|uniref:alpha/beta hydrolase n=1 Tax=Candidatus Albibeggiatoa sp. nov. NOAA TaxID=3162724 RepID=UPI0032F7960D|nr:alpha/beta fold hydrolase [Thiotrichaceae bacterium]
MKFWLKILAAAIVLLICIVIAGQFAISYQFAQLLTHYPKSSRIESIQHQPNNQVDNIFAAFGVQGYEKITLKTSDELNLEAIYIPSQNQASIIMLHGYKGYLYETAHIASLLQKHGYGAILPVFRAHGYSDGELITFGKNEVKDVQAAYEYLLTRDDVDPEKIGLVGNSMGGSIGLLYAATNPQIKAIVAQSPYGSLRDTANAGLAKFTNLEGFPYNLMMKHFIQKIADINIDELAPINVIADIAPRPVFILVSGLDSVVAPKAGVTLHDAAQDPKELWVAPNLEHAQFNLRRADDFEGRVAAFFNQYLLQEE